MKLLTNFEIAQVTGGSNIKDTALVLSYTIAGATVGLMASLLLFPLRAQDAMMPIAISAGAILGYAGGLDVIEEHS